MTDQYTPPPPPVADHRSAKADAKAAKAREKAMRPWFKKKRFMIPLVFVVIGGISAAAGGGAEDDGSSVASGAQTAQEAPAGDNQPDTFSGNSDNPPQNDVAIESCGTSDFGSVEAKLKVTNNSSKRSSYFIDVSYEGADGSQLDTGMAVVNNLEPGQSTVTEATAFTEADTEFTCRVVEVNRMAS